jgi:hypothetical protein
MTWKIALCSLSAGRMFTPYSAARGSTNGPPAISVSLLARQMSFLALIAATVCPGGGVLTGGRGKQFARRVGSVCPGPQVDSNDSDGGGGRMLTNTLSTGSTCFGNTFATLSGGQCLICC